MKLNLIMEHERNRICFKEMTLNNAPIFPDFILVAMTTLEQNGFEAYLVGGCVRDSICYKSPKDWDITTNALPEQIIDVFRDFKVLEHAVQYGTVTVLIDKKPIEITTYRIDGRYTDSRHPDSISYTARLSEDLSRRDFTVNALAYNEKTGIIDLFGGIDDLRKMRIQCVGDPTERFTEDALRIMRALRFASSLQFTIEKKTASAMIALKERLINVAAERVCVEFSKMIVGDGIKDILMEYVDVLGVFVPEILPMVGFDQKNPHHCYDVWGHVVAAVAQIEPDLPLRLTMFFHDIAKPVCFSLGENGCGHFHGHQERGADITKEIMERMRFEHKLTRLVVTLISCHNQKLRPDSVQIKEWLRTIGEKELKMLFAVKRADVLGKLPSGFVRLDALDEAEQMMEEILAKKECYSLKELKINGCDLIRIGFKEGVQVGDTLNELLRRVIEGICQNDESALREEAKKILQS